MHRHGHTRHAAGRPRCSVQVGDHACFQLSDGPGCVCRPPRCAPCSLDRCHVSVTPFQCRHFMLWFVLWPLQTPVLGFPGQSQFAKKKKKKKRSYTTYDAGRQLVRVEM